MIKSSFSSDGGFDEKFPFWEDKIDDEDETFPKESDFLLTIDILLSSAQQEQVWKFKNLGESFPFFDKSFLLNFLLS